MTLDEYKIRENALDQVKTGLQAMNINDKNAPGIRKAETLVYELLRDNTIKLYATAPKNR